MTKDRDEYQYIQDTVRIHYKTPIELEEAAKANGGTILEICSQQHVKLDEYQATREQCILDVMAELGQNPVFNDIFDVVAVSQMARPELETVMHDKSSIGNAGAYFSRKYITGNIYDLAFTSHAGDLAFSNVKRETLKGYVLHEFSHFAMSTVFKNDCNPYFSTSDPNIFSEAMLETMRNLYRYYLPDKLQYEQLTAAELAKSLEGLIDPRLETFVDVFKHGYFNREFVVRLPHILAELYTEDNYNLSPELRACLAPLILYWKDFITPEMRKYVDAYPKGHLLTADRVYEENMLAHNGGDYLLL